jgi:hypothetical protein
MHKFSTRPNMDNSLSTTEGQAGTAGHLTPANLSEHGPPTDS